jgi:peptide/nickel transport system substrate-binding protein
VFTVGLAELPGSLDPANALDRSALLITRHLYDGLTAFEPGGTRPVPALAVRWSASPDALEWTFELRPGVTFADGTPLTAQAVTANFERWLLGEPPGRYAFWRVVFGGFAREMDADGKPLALIAEARAVGTGAVVLTLNRPDATLPNSLAMPSFAIVNPAALAGGAEGLESASAGTGAYQLRSAPQPGLVRLERNPSHWRWAETGPTGADQLVFKVISDDTQRLLALQTGEIEAMTDIRPADYAAALAPGGPVRLVMDPALTVLYLGFNQARAPWGNADCRLAAFAALDPARYARDFFPGDAEPARALLPPAVWGYADTGDAPTHDLAAAQERWQACLATGTVVPETVTLYVPPIPRPYLPDPAALGEAVRSDLAALGINVEIASPEWETAWLPDVHSGRADLFLLGWSGINGDPDAFLCPLFCGLEGAFNSDAGGFPAPPDAELARVLLEARTTVDPAARERLYAQALERLRATLPAAPLTLRREAWAFRAGVEGYTPSPIDSVFFTIASPAWPASR